jgi:hypothetical protein
VRKHIYEIIVSVAMNIIVMMIDEIATIMTTVMIKTRATIHGSKLV